jgi:flagellar basal body-associated protein FliL
LVEAMSKNLKIVLLILGVWVLVGGVGPTLYFGYEKSQADAKAEAAAADFQKKSDS